MPSFRDKLSAQDVTDIVTWLWSSKPAQPTAPLANPEVPPDLPMVVNPKGKKPSFTLRDGRYVSAAQVKQALDAKQRIVLIDARTPSDWIQFHIPGAVSLSYYDQSQLDRVPKDGTWVVAYCACPHHASGEVVDALRARQYTNTAVLDEGILFWRDKGYPLAGAAIPGHPGPSASGKPPTSPSASAAPPKAPPAKP
jgi:rhodanese-related sulfurtransferase